MASDIVTNRRQRVRVVFMSRQGSLTIKLLEPLDVNSTASGASKKGGGLHHICFRCADLNTELLALTKKGAKTLVAPEPGEAFNNHDIAFLWAGNNLNIELIDTTEKSDWLRPSCSSEKQS